jgi:retron-type reverse transcriptase
MRINAKLYKLDQSPLYKLRSRAKLARLLGVSVTDLRRLTKNADSLYKEFEIRKKNGEMRPVQNPERHLKVVQGRLAKILARIAPPDYLYCPVKGRCYVSNAGQHRGNRDVRCLDIRRYFPSTSSRRVYWFFRSVMGCEKDIAATLACLATYKGCLPTGSRLSPIMAYYSYIDTWDEIARICKEKGYRLTVYIDDVTISGQSVDSDDIWRIKQVIHRSGLRYHKEKAYTDRPPEITGVIVDGERLIVPNRQIAKLAKARKSLSSTTDPEELKKLHDKISGLRGQMAQVAIKALELPQLSKG